MATPLEKARKDPGSMKAKILAVARQIFGAYGYSKGTIRMIAEEVGIDISTIHYHWGEKKDSYEAALIDVGRSVAKKLSGIEAIVHGLPLNKRFSVVIDSVADYLFEHREISRIILCCHSRRNPQGVDIYSSLLEINVSYSSASMPRQSKR